MKYTDLLKDSRWLRKRTKILKRDNYKCTVCSGKIKLSVHHTIYIEGKMPWDYPNKLLITLCDSCHYKFHCEHEVEKISLKQNHKTKHEQSLEYVASIIKKREDRKRRFYELHLKKFEK
jgi:hypothetical protein